jgi:hypothetical protein
MPLARFLFVAGSTGFWAVLGMAVVHMQGPAYFATVAFVCLAGLGLSDLISPAFRRARVDDQPSVVSR